MTEEPIRTLTRSPARPDRLLVVFSDVEMGGGGPTDDFPHSPFLGDLLLSYSCGAHDGLDVDLVFNGDTFDLLKTSYQGAYPHHITEAIAVAKLERVVAAHPRFFEALRLFLARRGRRGRVAFVRGNHDEELAFEGVQALIRDLLGVQDERLLFPGHSLDVGRVHITHGSQVDPLFAVDDARPFVDYRGQRLLNLSWATVALLDVAIPLQPLLHHHDRLRPKHLVLELMPEVRELLLTSFWAYWTKDYWQDLLSGADPMKQASWTMLRELVRRMVSWDPEVDRGEAYQRRMVSSDEYDLYLVGHQHEPGWWSYGQRKVIRTGCMRDEFMLLERGRVQVPINKSYAQVYMAGDDVVRSFLVEELPPPRPAGTIPDSIFAVLPAIRGLLGTVESRRSQRDAQLAQELVEQSRAGNVGAKRPGP